MTVTPYVGLHWENWCLCFYAGLSWCMSCYDTLGTCRDRDAFAGLVS